MTLDPEPEFPLESPLTAEQKLALLMPVLINMMNCMILAATHRLPRHIAQAALDSAQRTYDRITEK
jgi:hypothetical protein